MKKLTEEKLCLSGFRFDDFGFWYANAYAGSRLCFKSPIPFRNLVSWDARRKINSEITFIVFDKTNNKKITENYEKIN